MTVPFKQTMYRHAEYISWHKIRTIGPVLRPVHLSNQIANSITLSGENSLAIRRLQHQNTNLKANLDYMENRFNQIQDRLLQQEVERRQDNLIIHGIPEKTWEKKEQTEQMAREYISTALNMPTDDITFKNITRMGTRDRKKRPILITFMHSSDRQQIWKAKHDTGHTPELVNEQQVNTQDIGGARPIPPNVFITQDYPPEIQVRRRRLIPIFKRAKKLDEYRDTTYIRHDKLVIKGVTYTIHNLYYQRNYTPWRSPQSDKEIAYFSGVLTPLSRIITRRCLLLMVLDITAWSSIICTRSR